MAPVTPTVAGALLCLAGSLVYDVAQFFLQRPVMLEAGGRCGATGGLQRPALLISFNLW